jgi:nitrate/nitrite transporter NarK
MKPADEHNWRLYEANERYTDKLIATQQRTDFLAARWIFTLAGGSFGLSFAFIETLVPLRDATHKPLLIAAWGCFALAFVLEFIGMAVSSIRYTLLVAEADRNLALKYEGREPEYKRRGVFSDPNSVLMYAVLLVFFGGFVCLLIFLAQNILR